MAASAYRLRLANFGEPLDCELVGPLGSQQTAASHAARACAAMSYASSSRPAALCGSARSRSGTSTCDSSQSIIATRSAVMRMLPGLGSPWTTHVVRPGESRPRCSASNDTLRRHRAEVDLRPGLGVQKVGRRSPARALGPAVREPMQLAECVGDATPVGFGLGRSALHVGHHHQTVGEVPAVRGRDRHRHRHPFMVEVSQQVGLPREISVAPGTETTDREVPVDAHAPHVVGDSASEWFDASHVFAPLPECLPSHWRHFRGVPEIARANRTSRIGATRITVIVTRQEPWSPLHGEGSPTRSSNSRRNGKIAALQ